MVEDDINREDPWIDVEDEDVCDDCGEYLDDCVCDVEDDEEETKS